MEPEHSDAHSSEAGCSEGPSEAVFVQQDAERFVVTDLTRGPWDPDAQHGGAPASLLAHAFQELAPDDGLVIERISYEFFAPRPARLALSACRGGAARPPRAAARRIDLYP